MNKIKTLIPLSEFVSKIDEICHIEVHEMSHDHEGRQLELIIKYNNFLLQPLNIGMFVPADEDGNIINDPCKHNRYCADFCQGSCNQEYHEAKSRVLFEDWNYSEESGSIWFKLAKSEWFIDVDDMEKSNIEELLGDEISLTEQALKQIYG